MRISACPLLLALCALASSVPNAPGATVKPRLTLETSSTSRAQQKDRPVLQVPRTVNVRPRVTTSQPGTPTVTATADRNRVPLGELVTFFLTPANVISDSRYTVTILFGDGQQERVRQTKITHLYTTSGTFTYSILVKASERTVPTPEVKLLATPTSVKPDSPVNFKAELSHDYPNIKYRFVFADGSQTDWQDNQLATHSYRAPGIYQAYVDIASGNGRSVKQLGGSPRRPIEVTSARTTNIAVQLTANPLTVQAKDEVTFLAQVDPVGQNLTYRFDFGDRSGSTQWQAGSRAKHVYSSAGTYSARVEVRAMNRSGQQSASSKPLSIKVEAEQTSSTEVDLLVVPRSVTEGFPVYFKATAAPANSKTRYRFNFGDGSPPTAWNERREETHIYAKAGNYPAFVESTGRPAERVVSSNKEQVKVTPGISNGPPDEPTPRKDRPSPTPAERTPTPGGTTPTPGGQTPTPGGGTPTPSSDSSPTIGGVMTPTPSPEASPSPSATASPTPPTDSGSWDDWWKYVLAAALILFGGYQGWKYFFVPTPTLEPHVDPGDAALGAEGGPLGINFQMELDPNVDGQFAVEPTEGSLIKSERKSDG